MAKRRPSYKSIRARQRNLLEGIGTADVRYKEAAAKLGVTPRELKTFVETKPKNLRSNFNRSPAYRKLYGASTASVQRKQVRQSLGISRISRYEPRESEIQNIARGTYRYPERERRNRTQIGELIQNLYVKGSKDRYQWASYAQQHSLPTSIDTIRLLHRNGQIGDNEYMGAVNAWQAIYNVSQPRYEMYADDFPDYEEGEEYEEA